VLKAYFDASKRESGTFCVAGYAFTSSQVKKFDREWWALFGGYGGCHMTDLANKRGAFEGISEKEASRLVRGAIAIIKRRAAYGAVISCELPEIDRLLPKWIIGFQHAYPVCCHLAMTAMGNFIADKRGDSISYFFESGDLYSGVAHWFMGRTEDVPELKESYRHYSHTFIGKDDALALQAADVLAWEWTKFRDETLNRRVRKMRKSLIVLMADDKGDFNEKQYTGIHATGDPLRKFCRQVHELGLLQREEDRAARS
jgi:hypothetical protein